MDPAQFHLRQPHELREAVQRKGEGRFVAGRRADARGICLSAVIREYLVNDESEIEIAAQGVEIVQLIALEK